ncbi:MAG: Rrf2 family transcriptional regulator [Candidatus Edwardsbacteria bacterium]|nr:Rrf2 family transcriptional regulator [Candidatus Edwardsbacteria bacterium]MBU1577180.1 Rrf2 family transcriptional regulator [Candidatus Edwardsbacteria bacterium]MBU2462911.1 Rrf2 family transcriptional regulator [Candidatus Edwardsbacteria bacterium]MBU2593283.1 Rrf2 family transcriptional regulator [Candidatus Edwardsbacteria bacterium]
MLITKRNEYALQAMIILARQEKGRPLAASALAKQLKTTPAFMSKIAQQLAKSGLLTTKRGKAGGLFLGRPASRILVKDIFAAVDGALSVSVCMNQGRCNHHVCPIYPALTKLQKDLDDKLNLAKLSTFI